MGGLGKKKLVGPIKSSPMQKFCMGDWRWDLEKNRRLQCIGVKTSGPENNLRRRPGRQNVSFPDGKFSMGFPMLDLEKNQCIGVETWEGSENMAGSAIGPKKSSPMKKFSMGDTRWDLEKKSKPAMYRSEDIGARKQSPPAAGSAKSFLPDGKFSMGFAMLDLEKSVYRSGNMGGLGKTWPHPRSARKRVPR